MSTELQKAEDGGAELMTLAVEGQGEGRGSGGSLYSVS